MAQEREGKLTCVEFLLRARFWASALHALFLLHGTLWNYRSLHEHLRILKLREINSPDTLVSSIAETKAM